MRYLPLFSSVLLALTAQAQVTKPTVLPEKLVKIDPVLTNMALKQSQLPVLITMGAQPQRDLAKTIRANYEPRIEALAKQVRDIHAKYLPKGSFATEAEELKAFEAAPALTAGERSAIKSLNLQIDTLTTTMRKEIGNASKQAVEATQKNLVAALLNSGAVLKERLVILNAVSAIIPSAKLQEIAGLTGVAQVSYNAPGRAELDNQITSLGVREFWNRGIDGSGAYDVGVLDDGVLETHPSLRSHRFFENFAGNGNHGTGVAGMYASTSGTYRGLAFNLDAIVVEDAGDTSTSMAGADWMLRSAAQDPEVINYSFGNGASNDRDYHSMSFFVDGAVSDYGIIWAKSAGNNGPGVNTMTVPANNFNGLTVANMNDANTTSRLDDRIDSTSSSGPTFAGRKKPDISAPGSNTMTTNSSSSFGNLGGTSSAAPKVGAASLLLIDSGVFDPRAVKAILINSADSWEDNDTPANRADDNTKSGKEWNSTYGWGYLDLRHAFMHRNDFFFQTIRPRGSAANSFRLYKGLFNSGDKATLVWEIDPAYNNANTPTSTRRLSDLDLYLYEESSSNNLDSDVSVPDNVHQVSSKIRTTSVIKVSAYSPSFDGASQERFALATEEGFVQAVGPRFGATYSVSNRSSDRLNIYYDLTVRITNTGDLAAHGVSAKLVLPAGHKLVADSDSRTLGRILSQNATLASWRVSAPRSTTTANYSILTNSASYGESFTQALPATIVQVQ